MRSTNNYIRLAQSASTLGAALLGFGIGAKWGAFIYAALLTGIIIVGGIIHIGGMYVVQMKDSGRSNRIAKILWITAWICLVALIAIVLYLLLTKK